MAIGKLAAKIKKLHRAMAAATREEFQFLVDEFGFELAKLGDFEWGRDGGISSLGYRIHKGKHEFVVCFNFEATSVYITFYRKAEGDTYGKLLGLHQLLALRGQFHEYVPTTDDENLRYFEALRFYRGVFLTHLSDVLAGDLSIFRIQAED